MSIFSSAFLSAVSVSGPGSLGAWTSPVSALSLNSVGATWAPSGTEAPTNNTTDYLVCRELLDEYPSSHDPDRLRIVIRMKLTGDTCRRFKVRIYKRSLIEESVVPTLESDVLDAGWRLLTWRFDADQLSALGIDAAELARSDFGAGFAVEWDAGCVWGTGGALPSYGDTIPAPAGGGIDYVGAEVEYDAPPTSQTIEAASISTSEGLGVGTVSQGPAWCQQSVPIASGEFVPSGGLEQGGVPLDQQLPILSGETVPTGLVWRWGDLPQESSIPSGESFAGGDLVIVPIALFASSIASAEGVPSGFVLAGPVFIGPNDPIGSAESVGTDGSVFRTGRRAVRPLLRLSPPFDQLTAEERSSASGVPIPAFVAFDEGIAHWQLERNYRLAAQAMGLDPDTLRAAIRRAKSQQATRQAAGTDSNLRYGGLKTP